MGVPKKRQKPWRFEQMWLEDDGCRDIVDSAWRQQVSGKSMDQVEEKIKICQARLSRWSRLAFGREKKPIKTGGGEGNSGQTNG